MTQRLSQSGNALFYILLCIALFAALGYSFSQGRIGSSEVSDEKAKLYAAEIITQGNIYKEAISKIRLRGYTENQISFSESTTYNSGPSYSNVNCTDAGCKIFDQAGGALSVLRVPTGSQDPASTRNFWGFSGDYRVKNVGIDTNADLIAVIPNLNLTVCNKINSLLGVDSLLTRTGNPTPNAFIGNYGSSAVYLDSYTFLPGRPAACVKFLNFGGTANYGSLANGYHYYQVLIAR